MTAEAMLFRAFVAGFKQSGEGYNAEYPFRFDDGEIRDALRDDFEEWRSDLDVVSDWTEKCPDCGDDHDEWTDRGTAPNSDGRTTLDLWECERCGFVVEGVRL